MLGHTDFKLGIRSEPLTQKLVINFIAINFVMFEYPSKSVYTFITGKVHFTYCRYN